MRWVLAATALVFCLGAHCQVNQQPLPPDCPADVGEMFPALDQQYIVYPCFACEKAHSCFMPGNQYCCAGWMCEECSPTPHVVFPQATHDGGTR